MCASNREAEGLREKAGERFEGPMGYPQVSQWEARFAEEGHSSTCIRDGKDNAGTEGVGLCSGE